MSTVLDVTACLLALAGALTLLRLVRGPTTFDRVVAVDMLVVIVVSSVAVDSARSEGGANVLLLVCVSLVGFVSTLSVVRLMPEERT